MSNADLEKKLLKIPGGNFFKEEVDRLDSQQIKNRISQLQQCLSESEDHKENNDELKQLREQKSNLEAPYREVRQAVATKTKYLVELLKEKGE